MREKPGKKNLIWLASFIMLAGSFFVNGGNYIFALLSARVLGPDNYGTMAAIFSIVALTGIMGSTGNLLAMRIVARFAPDNFEQAWAIRQRFFKTLWKILLIVGIIIILLSPIILSVFKFNIIQLLFIIVLTILGTCLATDRGFVQGMQHYARVSKYMIMEVALKLTFLAIVIIFKLIAHSQNWLNLLLILSSYAVASLIVWRFQWRDEWKKRTIKPADALMPNFTYFVSAILSLGAVAIIMNSDILAAKAHLLASQAGQMAVLAKLGQIIFFSTSPVIGAVFPMISSNLDNGIRHAHLLMRALFLSLGLAAAVLLIFKLSPHLLIEIIFGNTYASFASINNLLFRMGVVMVFFTVGNLFVNYFLSLKAWKYSLGSLGIAILHVVLLFTFGKSLSLVVDIDLFSSSLLMVFGIAWYIYEKRTKFKQLINFDQPTWKYLIDGN